MSTENKELFKYTAMLHHSSVSEKVNMDLTSVNEPDLGQPLTLVAQVQNHSWWKYSVLTGLCSPADLPQLFLLTCID